ncbi:MAG TPA: YraN family protein [Pyrinomonadaceae bacterium]|nr:YraN family protein [Pyrinomonadaceae bacterium]
MDLLKSPLDLLSKTRTLLSSARTRFARTRFARAGGVEVAPHLELGRQGESLAAEYLLARGYKLVGSNFKLGVGRNRRGAVVQAEIDLVAYDGPTLCFVEVKTRASDRFAAPEANVDLRKQRQITRAARVYRRQMGLTPAPCRFDVVSVLIPPPCEDGSAHAPRLTLFRGFWTEDKFRKRRWSETF